MRTLLTLCTMIGLGIGVIGCGEKPPQKPLAPPTDVKLGRGAKENRDEKAGKAPEAKPEEKPAPAPEAKKEEPPKEAPKDAPKEPEKK